MTEAQLLALKKGFTDCLTGGNHLASNLINSLGASEDKFPVYGTSHEKVRKILSQRFPDTWISYYEQWCCWNAIMCARDNVEKVLGKDGWRVPE